jgi:hypothetical protein
MTDSHRGEDAAALAQLDALLAERPTWARAWRDRPLFLARSGDFAAARRALDDLRLRFGGLPGLDRLAALLASSALALAVEGGPPLQRAGAWAALGATAHAEAAYRAALPDELAGRWLVLNGSRPSALAVLRARPGDEAASAVFQERWPDDPAP